MTFDYTWMAQFCISCLAIILFVLVLASICLTRRLRKLTDKIVAEQEQNLKHIKIELDKVNKMLDEYENENNHQ